MMHASLPTGGRWEVCVQGRCGEDRQPSACMIDAYFLLIPSNKEASSSLALAAVNRFSYSVSTLLSAIDAGDPLYDGQNSAAAEYAT